MAGEYTLRPPAPSYEAACAAKSDLHPGPEWRAVSADADGDPARPGRRRPVRRLGLYAGSLSKILAPGLRLGWLVVPAHLAGAVAEAKLLADRGSPVIEQLALADFLVRGELDRHLRRRPGGLASRPIFHRQPF
ncbi:hypothetical protein ACIBO5_56615 [Nonomuraea angiospora]|uniref:hypothetical protein n=1 Tax=Nonomuraea angiospora TaxID=46172 RepID=UPI00379818B9